MLNSLDTKARQDLIKYFPKYFDTYLSDPTFANNCKQDPKLIKDCLESFEQEIREDLVKEAIKGGFPLESTIANVKKSTGNLHAFLTFLQSKFSGQKLNETIVVFFEERMEDLQERNDKKYANLSTLFAIALVKNPTVDIGYVRRIEAAIGSCSSENIGVLKESIKDRLKRGY